MNIIIVKEPDNLFKIIEIDENTEDNITGI